jgi:signal transduction histidine kinase/ActR/RegA family two-component response regulator
MRGTGNTAPPVDVPRDRATWQTVTLVVTALAAAATLVALTLTLVGANRQRDLALRLQAHSYDVMILTRTLTGTIAQSEAALGRYVISGDRSLGQLYVDGWREAGGEIDRLDRLTADNAEQQRRVAALRAAYGNRGEELSLTALSTNYGKNDQALARYYGARKAPALARINSLLDTISADERARLDRRTTQATRGVARASRIAGVLALVGVLLVLGGIALGWLVVRAVGERIAARGEAAAAQARTEELTAAVAQATSELRAQEATLRQAQKMEAVGQLTGGIAHDFNNMLAVVLGGLELAQRSIGRDPATVTRHLDSAREGADRAAALTRRLLAFSREEPLRPEAIEPAVLIAGMADLLDRTLGDAITMAISDGGDGWHVRADRVQLENAILNLAVNARDAMDGRGTLSIATGTRTLAAHEIDHCPAGDYATIAVRDTGHGMTPEIAERVFEPFFTTKEAGKGTGLGLSQIFALVRQLSGEIAIDTAPGRGTQVTLFLPRDRDAPVAMAVAAPVAVAPERGDGPLHVLVVEDDPRVLAATTGALTELGHRALTCADPLAAAAVLAEHDDVDLIVSDVLMPRQTGPEMIAALLPRFPHLAVLFVTGFAGETNAGEFGDHPVLRKPFTLTALESAIGKALRRERPGRPVRLAAE